MASFKRVLALTLGAACAVIGVVHLALGVASVPGESLAGATVDSRERFYGAIFAAYGIAWIWAARQTPPADRLMRFLAAACLLGGFGRILSLVQHGQPHWFQLVLGAVELVLPLPFLFPLSRRTSTTAAPATSSTPPTGLRT